MSRFLSEGVVIVFVLELAPQLALARAAIGGGVEFQTPGLTFVRVDASDRAVRYPGPAIETGGTVQNESFFNHDFRFQIGGGVQF